MIEIRRMEEGDLTEVAALEAENPSAWTRSLLVAELAHERAVLMVAVVRGSVVGWLGARIIPPEAELLKITVQQKKRRRGVAGALFSSLCSDLVKCGCQELFLEVRSQNIGAIKFYLANSCVQIGQRVLYYKNPDDDALLLKRELAGKTTISEGKSDENNSGN